MKNFPRIIFYGTPEFAVASLTRLVEEGYHVVAVVTAPDKPSGRGLTLNISPVKRYATVAGLPVLQPVNMKDPSFVDALRQLKPDLQIVIAFRMMPVGVWSLPALGTFNLHASILPQYRGAAPINWAIINGEKETGLTTFMLNEKIDEGRIICSERTAIGSDENAGELHDRLMILGKDLVIRTVDLIAAGKVPGVSHEQMAGPDIVLKPAPKIYKEDCRINWNGYTHTIYNFIRGLTPHPGVFCDLAMPDGSSQVLKVHRALPEITDVPVLPGVFFLDGKEDLKVSTKDGYLHLTEVQLAGRKPMIIGDFLRGHAFLFT